MAFRVYFDDSGTDPNQRVACASALIVPAQRIVMMEREWEGLKAKEGFSDFHTSEFVFRNPKSAFAGWDDCRQKRVFDRVRQITKKYGAQVFTLVVNKRDYDQIMPEQFRKYSGECHYSWALRHVVAMAQQWKLDIGVQLPYEWVFDHMEPYEKARREVGTVMAQAEQMATLQRGVKGDYTNVNFCRRESIAGLQCVDMIAWSCYQFGVQEYQKKPAHPFAKIAWDDFGKMPSKRFPVLFNGHPVDWNHVVVITAKNLKNWLEKELADGTSLVRFRQWEEEHKRPSLPRTRKAENLCKESSAKIPTRSKS